MNTLGFSCVVSAQICACLCRLRPKTARAHFGGLLGGEIKMLNTEGKSSAVLHTRFDEHQTDSEGMLRVGAFAARVQVLSAYHTCFCLGGAIILQIQTKTYIKKQGFC
jgi:hypothetical protein